MKYMNANSILPKHLIIEIQKYIQGETLYIPKKQDNYQKWGYLNGTRNRIDQQNSQIRDSFLNGMSMKDLAKEHYLSIETIKKIVYTSEK